MNSSEQGSAAVELAVSLPLLLVMIFGLIQTVLLINTKTVLDHAAYEGARAAAVGLGLDGARARVERVTQTLPRGGGFIDDRLNVSMVAGEGGIALSVEGRVLLLPFVREVVSAAGSTDSFTLEARSLVKTEPFMGI